MEGAAKRYNDQKRVISAWTNTVLPKVSRDFREGDSQHSFDP